MSVTLVETSRLGSLSTLQEPLSEKNEPSMLLTLWRRFQNPVGNPDPSSFSSTKKNVILLMVAVGSGLSPISATIYYPAIFNIQSEFHASDILMNATISIFTFSTAIFPLFWARLGEKYGRRHTYLISFFIAIIGNVCCALAVNMPMFLVFRGVAAIGSSSVMSMGAGTLGDIFDAHERGRAMAWYTAPPLLGPALGPVVGGALNQKFGWRSNFWFVVAATSLVWLAMIFFLPETSRRTASMDNSMNKKRKRPNPFAALAMYKYPNIALTICFTGILYMVFFTVNTIFTRTYSQQYGLDTTVTGLCYLPMAAGTVIGAMVGGQWSDRMYNRQVALANGESNPEMRLGGCVFYAGIVLQCIAFVVYGWCVQANVFWGYGLLCLFFAGIGLMVPYVTLGTYMVDCFRAKGASVTGNHVIIWQDTDWLELDLYLLLKSKMLLEMVFCLLCVVV
ncbi:major facilitator superfamily domain-containing protein [Halteromyces radiatus]|uniref:major facilitator superfamily domain-containing protein n=1 Tax=Halteromyces radiatus TaxID=101107 RepID=UPI00221FD59E|nr:major facilitator superfamily domain-containing protein [Halteromyces radiatus]KAI8088818.1 major facilitator superfamily domain-containing protein [Halteromyces radiatus]